MVHIGDFDLMVLMETKVTDQAYYHNIRCYDVVCLSETTMESGGVQGGVELFVQD